MAHLIMELAPIIQVKEIKYYLELSQSRFTLKHMPIKYQDKEAIKFSI